MTVKQFNFPTIMLWGPGAVTELAKRLATQRQDDTAPILLVTDPGLVTAGVAPTVEKTLRDAGHKIIVFTDVHPNPIEADVVAGAAAYRENNANAIIALGGGSPMDTAKAIAVLATHEGPLSRFDDNKGGDRYIDQPLPPIYAIATTAGTGSEVGRSGVIICADTKVKTIIFHPTLMPRIAVLDPELTVGLPAHVTAATGMDAFTHCLEAYLAKGVHPMADGIALAGMELVIANLPRAVSHPDDLDARGNMLIAASMGATAFQKGLGFIHSMAHPLSTRYGIHHGLANALLMPPALRWELDAKSGEFSDDLRARFQRVAALFGPSYDQGEKLPDAIADLNHRIGIKDTLADHGLKSDHIPDLAEEASHDACYASNPVSITRADFEAAFRSCL